MTEVKMTQEEVEKELGVAVHKKSQPFYRIECECGKSVDGPSLMQLKFAYKAHRFFIHKEGREGDKEKRA